MQFLSLSKTTSIPVTFIWESLPGLHSLLRHSYPLQRQRRANAQTITPPQLLQTLILHWDVTTNNVIFDNTCIYVFRPLQCNRQGASLAQYPQRNTTCGLG